MKKRLVAVLAMVAVLITTLSFSASATTQQDLIEVLKNDPDFANVPYAVNVIVEQADNFNFTSDECDYLLAKFYEFKAIILQYGPISEETAHLYGDNEIIEVRDLIADVVTTLGYTCAYIDKAKPLHPGDIIFRIYDANGNIVFEYDGDYIKHTDEVVDSSSNVTNYIILGAGIVLLAAALIFVIKGRKNFANIEGIGA